MRILAVLIWALCVTLIHSDMPGTRIRDTPACRSLREVPPDSLPFTTSEERFFSLLLDEPESAQGAALEALRSARTSGWSEAQARALCHLGIVSLIRGERQEARGRFEEALERVRSLKETEVSPFRDRASMELMILRYLTLIAYGEKDHTAGSDNIKAGLDIRHVCQDPVWNMRFQGYVLGYYQRIGQYDSVFFHGEKWLGAMDEADDALRSLDWHTLLAKTYMLVRRKSDAARHWTAALELNTLDRAAGPDSMLVTSNYTHGLLGISTATGEQGEKGRTLFLVMDYCEAWHRSEQVLRVADRLVAFLPGSIRYEASRAMIRAVMARAANTLGRSVIAAEHRSIALDAQRVVDTVRHCMILNRLGMSYLGMAESPRHPEWGSYRDSAVVIFDRLHRIASERAAFDTPAKEEYRKYEGMSLFNKGNTLTSDMARMKCYLEAVPILRSLGGAAAAQRWKQDAVVAYQLARMDDYAEALRYADMAIRDAEAIPDQQGISYSQLTKAHVLYRKVASTTDPDSADLVTAITLFQEVEAVGLPFSTKEYFVMADICYMLDRSGEAQRYTQIALDMWEKNPRFTSASVVSCIRIKQLLNMQRADSALSYARAFVERSKAKDDSVAYQQALKCLGMAYQELGMYREALDLLGKWYALRLERVKLDAEREVRLALNEDFKAQQREHTIDLLEKDKALQSAELQHRAEALRRRQLQVREHRQQIQLLSRAAEIRQLEMSLTEANLRGKEAESARNRQRIELLEKDRSLQAASLSQETTLRNSAIAGAVLILLLSALLVRHLRQRRRVSELRAAAAEANARKAELNALRVQAEAERKETEIQRLFSHRLLDSQERERTRIARDLHDSLGQKLAVIRSRAQLALEENETDADAHALLGELSHSMHDALQELRSISHNLHPPVLDTFGLTKALEDMIRTFEAASETEWTMVVSPEFEELETGPQLTLYRILQEAANNVIHHAQARHASIRLSHRKSRLHITVEDDGCGFDVEGSRRTHEGLGLRSMRERMHMLGGSMTIVSREGAGTKLLAEIPAPASAHPPSTSDHKRQDAGVPS